jgi:hypothetical protein
MATPRDNGRTRGRTAHPAAAVLIAGAATGCTRAPAAPTSTVFGSFFPAWIVCALAGLVATLVTRVIFVRTGLDEHLPVRLLVYVGLTLLWAIGLWFAFFGGRVA